MRAAVLLNGQRFYNTLITQQKFNMQVQKLLQLYGGTQSKMGAALGVPQSRISEYITGKKNITVKRLKQWCDILNIDIKLLFE